MRLFLPTEKLLLIKRSIEGEKVSVLCKEAGISRKTFYVWLKKYKSSKPNIAGLVLADKRFRSKHVIKVLDTEDRRLLVNKALQSQNLKAKLKKRPEENIVDICRDFNVSRKTLYKWLSRYKSLGEKGLKEQRVSGQAHYRAIPEEKIRALLKIVSDNPRLSVHSLAKEIGFVGHHGIQNVLAKHNLSTYEQRLAYHKLTEKAWKPNISLANILYMPLKIWRMIYAPFATIPKLGWLVGRGWALLLVIFVIGFYTRYLVQVIAQAQTGTRIGLFFASLSLTCGLIFLIYSLKYYFSTLLVLRLAFGGNDEAQSNAPYKVNPLLINLETINLLKKPMVSIHVAVYNEKRVVERLFKSITSQDYPNYEVIIADDSNDETTDIIKGLLSQASRRMTKTYYDDDLEVYTSYLPSGKGPTVKLIHRFTRAGYKGAALQKALENTDSKAKYIVVFDADFVPYPDTIEQFLKSFQEVCGDIMQPSSSNIAAVQGYQWHVLNKSQTWVTRGVRTEYAGSYVIERASEEIYGGLKQIAGSVYCIRADILRKFGWGTSITEDFELTLRLYEKGYKVVFTPYIQTAAEAVSTIRRLVRQRMRWAEGASFNVKNMFLRILTSPHMNFREKMEFIYLAPYYLQAAFFVVGTLSWFMAEAVLRARLPFWTAAFGWSLVFTNLLALPLMNIIGLFLEESEERDYVGILSFVALSYIIVPFAAYAAIKGFVQKREGPWFRTPKTGIVTDKFGRSHFEKFFGHIFGRPAIESGSMNYETMPFNSYLKPLSSNLALAYSKVEVFRPRKKQLRGIGKIVVIVLLIFSIGIGSLAVRVPTTKAAANQLFLLSTVANGVGGYPNVATTKEFNATANSAPTATTVACTTYGKAGAGTTEMFFPTGAACGATSTTESKGAQGWFFTSQTGTYPSGTWSFTVTLDSSVTGATHATWMLFADVMVYDGATYTTSFYSVYNSASQACSATRPARTTGTAITSSTTATDYTWSCTSAPAVDLGVGKTLYVEYFIEINSASGSASANVNLAHNGNTANNGDSSITTTTFGVPEGSIVLLPLVPLLPRIVKELMVFAKSRKRARKHRKK